METVEGNMTATVGDVDRTPFLELSALQRGIVDVRRNGGRCRAYIRTRRSRYDAVVAGTCWYFEVEGGETGSGWKTTR